MAPHSSILAWRIPWTGDPDRVTVHGATKSCTQLTNTCFSVSVILPWLFCVCVCHCPRVCNIHLQLIQAHFQIILSHITGSPSTLESSQLLHPIYYSIVVIPSFFFFLGKDLFILFLAALGLYCCVQPFSGYYKQGLLSSCGALTSYCHAIVERGL